MFFLATFSVIGIGVPVAMGVAVLRYRLYDLDVVIKKTVLYATVAALLAAVFVVAAVLIGSLAGTSDTAAVVVAAVIGVRSGPLSGSRGGSRTEWCTEGGRPRTRSSRSSRRGSAAPTSPTTCFRVWPGSCATPWGQSRATVWLRVGDELRPAALSPTGDAPRRHLTDGRRAPLARV